MKKGIQFLMLIALSLNAFAQDTTSVKPSNIKPESFAIKLGLYDFKKTVKTDDLSKTR
jgi:hypothetical protein